MVALAQTEGPQPLRFTFDDVMKMVGAGVIDEDARVELLDGELIELSPQMTPHAMAKSLLARVFARQLSLEHQMIVDATLRFAPDQVTEPDLYFYPAGLKHAELRGSDLLLIVEVADSSLSYDLGRKMRAYARQAVPEYWVFNVRTRETTVHREATQTGYAQASSHAADEVLCPRLMPEVSLVMADLPHFS